MPTSSDIRSRYRERMKNQPQEILFCRRCVMSNQRPRIRFDAEGICSACRYAEKKRLIDWAAREEQFRDLLAQYRSKNGAYDVIVPCSGGKDSAMVAHQLRDKYGMHPLTVTYSPFLYTDNGWTNLRNFIDAGFDNILFTPKGNVYRRLCRLGFEVMGDPFQPFIYGTKAYPLHVALQYGIPLVMYGENGEVEYGGDDKNEESATHDTAGDLTKHYFSGIDPDDWVHFDIRPEDLMPFSPPDRAPLEKLGIRCVFFGYYNKWIPQENYYYCVRHTGFQANPNGRSEGTYSKYASLDDRVDGFHYYMGFIKFGIGRTTSDAAHEVRDGHITREEAVALVRRYDGELPKTYFPEFLAYTGLDEGRFWEIVDSFRLPHVWSREGSEWRLKRQVE